MTIIDERLAALDDIKLHAGNHSSFEDGHCAMEVVAWLADEGHTDAPQCASPYLRRFTIRLNDRWNEEKRQSLKPFLPRMVGTGGDGKDPIRQRIAAQALCGDLLPPWLRLAGLDDHAERVEAAADATYSQMVRVIRDARDAGWEKRRQNRALLEAKVREHLAAKPADAAAAAAAAADAVAAAVAAAVADAVADAAAAAVAAAVASPNDQYMAAYRAARQYYRDNPLAVGQEIADLAAEQDGVALDLLDRLIDANETRA